MKVLIISYKMKNILLWNNLNKKIRINYYSNNNNNSKIYKIYIKVVYNSLNKITRINS